MDIQSFLNSTKDIDTSTNLKKETLSNFLSSTRKEDNGKEELEKLSKTLSIFLKGTKNNIDTNSTYAKQIVINEFLNDKGVDINNTNEEGTLKSILNSDITQDTPFGDVNLTKLVYYNFEDDIVDKEFLRKYLKSTKDVNRNVPNNSYALLLSSLNEVSGDKIKGFSNFLAQSQILNKTKIDPIKIDLEIQRINFTVENETFEIQRAPLSASKDYFFGANKAKHNREKLQKISQFLSKMDGVKSVVRASNIKKSIDEETPYVIPDWSDKDKRKLLDMRVRQSNRLVRKPIKNPNGLGLFTEQNKFTKALIDILTPKTDTDWAGEKAGFHSYGASPDKVSSMRPIARLETPSESNNPYNVKLDSTKYNAIAKDYLKTFDEDGFVYYNVNRGAIPLILPMLPLSGIKVPQSIVSMKNGHNNIGVNRDSAVKEAFKHLTYNMSIRALLDRAPDFRQNMYLGLFILTKNDQEIEKESFYDMVNNLGSSYKDDWALKLHRNSQSNEITKAYESFKNIVDTYYVRMEGINIPGATATSYEIPFLDRKIKKISNLYTESHKMTINFTLDETGSILRNFDLLAGNFSHQVGQDKHNEYARNMFPISFNHANNSRLDLVVTYNDFRIGRSVVQGEKIRTNYLPAQQDVVQGDTYISNGDGSKIIGDRESYRQFILEDVRILGFSGNVQFQRDSANKISVPVDIMFKRISTVDGNIAYKDNT